jgi:Rrf2 family protein
LTYFGGRFSTKFSSKFATAIHILLYLEQYQDEEKVTSEVLADTTWINPVNIRKILTALKKSDLVKTRTGVGGSYLAKRPEEIDLEEVFMAVEDPRPALFRMHEHPNENCPVGRSIKLVLDKRLEAAKAAMLDKLAGMRLSDLYQDMQKVMAEKEERTEKDE